MKKIYLAFISFFVIGSLCSTLNSCSDDDNSETILLFDELPSDTKQFIQDHFGGYEVEKVAEKSSGYVVSLAELVAKPQAVSKLRYEIEFDRQGNWVEMEGRNDSPLPDNILALFPRTILSYVVEMYSPRKITEIKKEAYGYKVELTGSPDVELMFDYNGVYLAKDEEGKGEVIEYDQLPILAKSFLETHFGANVPSKIEKDGDSYDVEYTNKIEVEFYIDGNWKEVDAEHSQMPQTIVALLPKAISDYITQNYSSKIIEKIKNKVSSYEIELNGDVDLTFDKDGNFWGNNKPSHPENGNRPTFSELPTSVQAFINKYFSQALFLYAERDDNEYEVKLSDGTDIEFTISGELKSIEVLPGRTIPDGIVLDTILVYVNAHYAGKKIEEYEISSKGYKVELAGYPEIELLFDSKGNFKGKE